MKRAEDKETNEVEKKRELSAYDLRAARNVRNMWLQHKKDYPHITQTQFCRTQMTQNNFSQYITGRSVIGLTALYRLSQLFNCAPSDIRPELALSPSSAALELVEDADIRNRLNSAVGIIESLLVVAESSKQSFDKKEINRFIRLARATAA